MQVRKAVITAAAPNQNRLPLQQLVDRTGVDKTALQLIVEETLAAGVEEICVVIQPGDREGYRSAAGDRIGSLRERGLLVPDSSTLCASAGGLLAAFPPQRQGRLANDAG